MAPFVISIRQLTERDLPGTGVLSQGISPGSLLMTYIVYYTGFEINNNLLMAKARLFLHLKNPA